MRALLALALLGCGTPAPELVEVGTPNDTRDAAGPYRVSAITRGAVDRVEILFEGGGAIRLERDGAGHWRGDLPGAEPGTRLEFRLRAEGPGGAVERPAEGFFSFRVLNAEGLCLVDGDCLPREICDRIERVCQGAPEACADDGDCGMDYVCGQDDRCRFRPDECATDDACGAGRECINGVCAARPECRTDEECPAGRCLFPPGRCAANDQCARDADCPADAPVCLGGRCQAEAGCVGGCPAGERCERGVCVGEDACGGRCAPGTRCVDALDRCVECGADGECGPGRHCDLDRFACRDGARGLPCAPCAANSECGAGTVCAQALTCAIPCARGDSCPQGMACVDGACLSSDDPSGCAARACARDADCPSGVCNAGHCEVRQFCRADRDCAEGRRCADGRCVWRAEECGGRCPEGQLCLAGHCQPNLPGPGCGFCELSGDCPSLAFCADVTGNGPQCVPLCNRASDCVGQADCLPIGALHSICVDPEAENICPESSCPRDAYEPNNDLESARPTRLGDDIRGTTCPEDPDVFGLPAGATRLVIDVERPAVVLLYRGGRPTTSARLLPRQSNEVALDANDAFLMRSDDGPVGYSVRVTGDPPIACDDDNLEDNDAPQSGTRIRTGANIGGRVCGPDADWFDVRMDADQGGELVVSSEDPGLRWELRTGGGALRSGGIVMGRVALPLAFQPDGWRFGLLCEGACPETGAAYRLTTDFESGAVCRDDPLEPNDNRGDATRIEYPTRLVAVVCDRRPDWFVFQKPRGQRVDVAVRFDHDRGDIDLSVQAARGGFNRQSDGVGDVEEVSIPADAAAGDYYIQVYVLDDANEYSLEVSR